MDSTNPYQSPAVACRPAKVGSDVESKKRFVLHAAWAGVFALNLVVPLLFGLSLIKEHGGMGVAVAVAMILGGGWCACSYLSRVARATVAGGLVVAAAQLLPLLQIMAGLVGVEIAETLALADRGGDINCEAGGLVVTLVTGGLLIALSAGLGFGLKLITPSRWWAPGLKTFEERYA